MKTIKNLSILVSLLIIILVIVNYVNHRNQINRMNKPYLAIYKELDKRLDILKQQEKRIKGKPIPLVTNPQSNQLLTDTAAIHYQSNVKQIVENSDKLIGEVKKTIEEQPSSNDQKETTNENKFLFKLVFSAIFLIAALYVVLSNKYGEDTRKWAFSVLSLIAGIWIGSV